MQAGVTQDEVLGDIRKNWGWMLALGIVMVILGVIGLGMSTMLTIVSVLYFGVLMLFGSGAQFVQAARSEAWKGRLWHILIAIVYLVAGLIMLLKPALASVTLTLMIAWSLVAIGILRIIIAIQMRGISGWVWTLLGGVVTIALGIMIMNQWPVSGLWVIGMFVAIEMLFAGWSQIAIALAAKNTGK
jgi:uncharacterized membrane protein HdeD (DUF308 family)